MTAPLVATPPAPYRLASRGATIAVHEWPALAPARGTVVAIHGLGDHGGLFRTVAATLPAAGWRVVAPDLRGHGLSSGGRAVIDRWDDYRADLGAVLDDLETAAPGQPVAWLGQSMGALVALDAALAWPGRARALVLAAPPVGDVAVPAPLMLLARLLSPVWPGLQLRTGMDLAGLAADPVVRDTLLADPLFHRVGTPRLATEFERVRRAVLARAAELDVPMLVLHGADDTMVPPAGSRAFVARCRGDVTLREVAGARHAVLADTGHEAVLAGIVTWLAERASGAG